MAKVKGQAAMEFMIVFGLVMIIFLIFLRIAQSKVAEANEKGEYAKVQNLADDIKSEVILASQVHDNYIRRFQLPLKIKGEDYTIRLKEGQTVEVQVFNGSKAYSTLPVNVEGNFADRLEENSAEHCISKNKGTIRIARNQASVELYKTTDTYGDGYYDPLPKVNGVYQIGPSSEFYAYIKINCVDNLMGIEFKLEYDNDMIETVIDPASRVCSDYSSSSCDSQDPDPLFTMVPDLIPFGPAFYSDPICAPMTSTFSNSYCYKIDLVAERGDAINGYGNTARIKFRAKSNDQTSINIVPNSIILTDITTSFATQRGLPSSLVGADLCINC